MKKYSLSIIALLFAFSTVFSQSPQAFKYQGVARDNSGAILVNQNVGLRISIIQGEITGSAVYSETHAKQTSSHGLINLEIGKGTVQNGDFTTIDWGTDKYFVKIEIDATGGTNYSVLGTSQLMSVPYALYAGNCFDFNYPDGFANQIPVTEDISNNKTYTVPSGKNLYIQFARNDLKIGNNTISQTYQNKMIVGEGEVVTGLENSNNFFVDF